jgi:hypothetical protein
MYPGDLLLWEFQGAIFAPCRRKGVRVSITAVGACTIVARNFLPQARVLANSLKRVHPEIPFHVLVIDDDGMSVETNESGELRERLAFLGDEDWNDMAFRYSLVEMATAVKPFLLDHLLQREGYEKVIYLDPDMLVLEPMTEVLEALSRVSIVLTPHILSPEQSDAGAFDPKLFLFVGAYNLGFLGIRNGETARRFLSWWKQRLRWNGYAERVEGLHVDQKWCDLLHGFFADEVCVLQHPGYNVSHWNLHERHLTTRDGRWLSNDRPLVCVHFSGFDANHPETLTGPHKQSAVRSDQHPALLALASGYASALRGQGLSEDSRIEYRYSRFYNGYGIVDTYRRIYRRLREDGYQFGDPFRVDEGSFFRLLKKNGLLYGDSKRTREYRRSEVTWGSGALTLLRTSLLIGKTILGARRYFTLMRVLRVIARPEEQVFLLRTLKREWPVEFAGKL